MEQAPGPSGTARLSKTTPTQNMAANIKVVVRVRPLNQREMKMNTDVIVDVANDKMLVLDPKEKMQQPDMKLLKRASKELKFEFDNVCGQNAFNQDVFETTTKDILGSLMDGYNCSVFAYGATGAGKSFTMTGSKDNPGITNLSIEHLFDTINCLETEREFNIAVSYIKVYDENVYDLLKPSRTPLQLRADSKCGVTVVGLTKRTTNTARELLKMLEDGNKKRTQQTADANAESSRSHTILQVYVQMRYKTSGELRIVKLSMIDLAGSERDSATRCVGDRFKKRANIKKSLLCLGNCFNRLAAGNSYNHYRDTKLTHLLKDILGGKSKVVLIANVSPARSCYEDTFDTLKYAARASKNIVDGDMRPLECIKKNGQSKKVNVYQAKFSKEKAKLEWRKRLYEEDKVYGKEESQMMSLLSRQFLATTRELRTRSISHDADRSPSVAVEQIYIETENNMKQKCHESRRKLNNICEQALAEFPELTNFVDKLKLNSELRHIKTRNILRQIVSTIKNDEIRPFTRLTWSDDGHEGGSYFKCISTLDVHKPSTSLQYSVSKKDDVNATVDIITDSEAQTVIKNKIRKGTLIKLPNYDLNDSLESLDTTRNLKSAK